MKTSLLLPALAGLMIFYFTTPRPLAQEPEEPPASPAITLADLDDMTEEEIDALSEEQLALLMAEQGKAWEAALEDLGWQREGTGDLGSHAEIQIPEGFRFTGPEGAAGAMDMMGNIPTGREAGLIGPESLEWFVVFEFDPIGYVDDSGQEEIDDPSALMAEMQRSSREANKMREEYGLETYEVIGWSHEPHYNESTNNLEWGLRMQFSETEGETVNYLTKILGRRGVMDATLVGDVDAMSEILPLHQQLISTFTYKQGETYAEYTKGDQLAKIGLAGLIAGGGFALAAKSGLLSKLWKPLAAGVAVLVASIIGIFKKLTNTGRGRIETE